MNTPAVSIPIPTYNRADPLPFIMESILAQSVEDFELIIVDDGSTDETANVMARFDDHRIRYLRFDTNTGHLSKVRNIGLRAARGKFITMGDSDDLWRPTYLETQLRLLRQRPEVGFFFVVMNGSGIQQFCRKPITVTSCKSRARPSRHLSESFSSRCLPILWKNRLSLGKALQKLKRDNDARREFLACARLQPWRYQAYASYLSAAVRRRKQTN